MTTSQEWAERFAGYVPSDPMEKPMSDRQSATEQLRMQTAAATALLAAYQDILGDDADAHRDAVEGETDLHEAIRAGLARIVELRALVAANEKIQDDLRARLKRFGDQEDSIRAAMLAAMEVGNLPKLETALGTISRRAVPPSLVVVAESEIPPHYFVPQPPKLDKRALLASLKAGQHVSGAELSNGGATIALKLT